MWLPRPIYESLPWAYWVIGILMLVLIAYVGEIRPVTFVYAASGALCFIAGVVVSAKRARARRTRSDREVTE